MNTHSRFWEYKSLAELTTAEWESLCDGCGKCCLHKLEDEDSGQVFQTNVACYLLDINTGYCRRYDERSRWVHDCVQLTPDLIRQVNWLPSTCAYRRCAENKPLPAWHPLITGDLHSTRRAGMSVSGRVISERQAGRLEQHIVNWFS